ncbi:hypothetical protein PFISCL1PPCAC_22519, partial [Pristionchus fissidentatus]
MNTMAIYLQNSMPVVYATGFDSINDPACRPVYTPSTSDSVWYTSVPVYSPIATIDFHSNTR